MKRKKIKGRKIYKTKEKNYLGKSPMSKFMSGALTVLLIGGIGFLGYSLAEPIINYTRHEGDELLATETLPNLETGTTTAITTNSTLTTLTTCVSSTESAAESTVSSEKYGISALKADALLSIKNLESALLDIDEDKSIGYVEVPLKVRGGNIYYKTSVIEAQSADAVKSSLTLDEIFKVVNKSGFKPVAVISILSDNVLPSVFPEAGYTLSSGKSQWTDSLNGMPFASPYSQITLDYMTNIVGEVSGAGFENIICSDIEYPQFTEEDYAMLKENLKSSNRFMALTSIANLLYEKALENGASVQIEVSAADVLRENSDILQPILLSSNNIILDINIDELKDGIAGEEWYEFNGTAAENAEKCMLLINEKLKDFNVAVRISGDSYEKGALEEAKDKISVYGYLTFVVK